MKWANAAGKMMLIDLLDPELPQMVNLLKNTVSFKYDKMMYSKMSYVCT